MVKKILFFALVVLLLCFSLPISAAAVPAAETEGTEMVGQIYTPRLLPGQPLYFLKVWWERVRLFVISDPVGKINYSIGLIKKRLAEGKTLLEREEVKQAGLAAERYQQQIGKTLEKIDQLQTARQQTDELKAKVAEATLKHQEILLDVYDKVPEPAKEGVLNAIDKSKQGYQQAAAAIESTAEKGNLEAKAEQVRVKVQQFIEKAAEQSRQQLKKGLGTLEKETRQGLENLGIED